MIVGSNPQLVQHLAMILQHEPFTRGPIFQDGLGMLLNLLSDSKTAYATMAVLPCDFAETGTTLPSTLARLGTKAVGGSGSRVDWGLSGRKGMRG